MAVLTLRQWLGALAAVAVLLLCCAPVQASTSLQLNAQKIEAGLVYNFLKYTTWPRSSLSEEKPKIFVCLFGQDAFDGYLDPLEGRTAQQYVIAIKRINRLEQLDSCHLAFIHQSQEGRLEEIIAYTRDKNILTVSNIPNFAAQGGMVEFYRGADQRVHLNINARAVNIARLHIQDRMIRLAEVVQ